MRSCAWAGAASARTSWRAASGSPTRCGWASLPPAAAAGWTPRRPARAGCERAALDEGAFSAKASIHLARPGDEEQALLRQAGVAVLLLGGLGPVAARAQGSRFCAALALFPVLGLTLDHHGLVVRAVGMEGEIPARIAEQHLRGALVGITG